MVDIATTCDVRTMRADRRQRRPQQPELKLSAAVPQTNQPGMKFADIADQILGKTDEWLTVLRISPLTFALAA
jgi:hypothetical protein